MLTETETPDTHNRFNEPLDRLRLGDASLRSDAIIGGAVD